METYVTEMASRISEEQYDALIGDLLAAVHRISGKENATTEELSALLEVAKLLLSGIQMRRIYPLTTDQ